MPNTFSTGITPATANPAKDLYDNTIAPALTSAGWTFIEQVTDNAVHNIGVGFNAEVWQLPAGVGYIVIAYAPSAGQAIYWRLSEGYNISTHKLIRPAHGGEPHVSYTVGADGSKGNGTEYIISTTTDVGYITTYAIYGGTPYILKVTDKYLCYSSRYALANYHVEIGEFTDLQTVAGSIPHLMIGGHSTLGISWTANSANRGYGKVTREVGVNSQSVWGAWNVIIDYPFPVIINTTGSSVNTYNSDLGMGRVLGAASANIPVNAWEDRNHAAPIVGTATLHNIATYTASTPTNKTSYTYAALRGYMPDFVIGIATYSNIGNLYQQEPTVGTQWTVGGNTYYVVGQCNLDYSNTPNKIGILAVSSAI